ncbi:hypothetical protein HYZ64_00635 [Candidatus Berkelbacteria bacterium]|nr:hypothetical protein [Candidatus Berkelbacteria bacterium]
MGAQQVWLRKLSREDREELFIDLARAVAAIESPTEAATLLKDLLTEAEIGMVAKRLSIAELLVGGVNYQEISNHLKVSYTTIARVSGWLNRSGEGFRLVIQRMKPARERDQVMRMAVSGAKRGRATMYNWPEKLLEEFMITATKKQRGRIKEIIETSKEKTEMHRELERMLKRFD